MSRIQNLTLLSLGVIGCIHQREWIGLCGWFIAILGWDLALAKIAQLERRK